MNYDHIIGSVFSLLTIVEHTGEIDKMRCACSCGNAKIARLSHLRSGSVKSCGCLLKTMPKTVHGTYLESRRPEYKIWASMLERCQKPTHHAYARYGGRGIAVCDRWASEGGYTRFLDDMGRRPDGLSLDRIDNDSGYSPENCRWATRKTQGLNRSTNVMLTHNGKTMPVSEWSLSVGLTDGTLRERLRRGWEVEKALNTPPVFRGLVGSRQFVGTTHG